MAGHLHTPAGQLARSMSAAEFGLWAAVKKRHGFTADRIAWGLAVGFAYLGKLWDGKKPPADLIPEFEPVRRGSKGLLRACLSAVPGSQVTTYPRG